MSHSPKRCRIGTKHRGQQNGPAPLSGCGTVSIDRELIYDHLALTFTALDDLATVVFVDVGTNFALTLMVLV
ncbi:hypothetical protein FB461_1042 [Rarobacter faecitabidus]|uniref:Uncharacterized protein n=1 Tax=Rarobacter faecitabidus TaxID=13243 RepID=A0A542ZWC3_RARFA|nr:hypothetical protein FB461_1042 [Rarobacter faecitabidus]